MQCFEFEAMLRTLHCQVRKLQPDALFARDVLADVLHTHQVAHMQDIPIAQPVPLHAQASLIADAIRRSGESIEN